MVIRLSIEQTEPLMGSATDERGAPVHFVGWMAMLRAISDLVDATHHRPDRDLPRDPSPDATTEQTATITWIGQRDVGRAETGRADREREQA
jgi:hypothetical protein